MQVGGWEAAGTVRVAAETGLAVGGLAVEDWAEVGWAVAAGKVAAMAAGGAEAR